MNFKKLLTVLFISLTTIVFAQESATKAKLYGWVENDFFYNSRQNTEMVDGIIQLFPKPVSPNSAGTDLNAVGQAEMLSVHSRLGVDITGTPILGAKTCGKIEADFAGTGTTYFILRVRHAYMKLNWEKTELTIGQTWHPLFGTVYPTTPSSNSGAPFQAFNRSPQLRVKENLSKTLSLTAAALYEMQYASQGPSGTSNIYNKNAMIPDLYVGVENKTTHWITGAGLDLKTIKPGINKITSASGVAFAQFSNDNFTIKGKAIYGQNLSDQLMIGGYGICGVDSAKNPVYTNINNGTCWLNAVYGKKIQAGLLLGLTQNLGTNKALLASSTGTYTIYGCGAANDTQLILDKLIRVAPHVSYNLPNMKFAVEYDYTTARYGKMNSDAKASNPYNVANNRIVASVLYIF